MPISQPLPKTSPTPAPRAAAPQVPARGKVDPIRELKDGRDTTQSVQRWDRFVAASEAKAGGSFGEALAAHGDAAAWTAFSRETFAKLYDSGLTKELPDAERPAGSDWVAKLHESAEALPEWRALRERAKRDAWACGIAAGEALRVLAQTVEPPKSDPQAIQDEIEFVKQLADGGKATSKQLRKLAKLANQKKEALEEHARAGQVQAAKGAAIRSALRGAAMRADEQIGDMADAMMTLGAGDQAGALSRVNAPPAEIRATLLKNKKLRKILKLAGRMKTSAMQKQRTKARTGSEELCDVKLGSDLQRLVPSELVFLCTEDTEALLYRRILEGAALTYELRGRETRSEGPIIMLVDESGSMAGENDEWAKSVAMALMEVAARQNRPFAYVHFDSRVSRVDEVPSPKSISLAALEELVSYFTGGGTSVGAALAHAATMLETAAETREKPWKRADVILVSDGVSNDDAAQTKAIDRVQARGGHLYSIFISTDGGHSPCATRADEKVCILPGDIRSGDPSKLGNLFSI